MGHGAAQEGLLATATRRDDETVDAEACRLRAMRPEDLEVIRAWLDDEGIRSFAGGESALAFVDDATCDAVTLTDASGDVVGFATLEPCLDGQSPMVLMAIDPDLRGHGLGTRLYEELAAWGRENTEFGAVYGEISPDNPPSRRAAEKAGWVSIGTDSDGYQTFCSAPAPTRSGPRPGAAEQRAADHHAHSYSRRVSQETSPRIGPSGHLRFLSIVLRHKVFVFQAGLRTGAPIWRLIIHDWSKFTRKEWGAYARRYIRLREKPIKSPLEKESEPLELHLAWTDHWHRNPHHWEHWLRLDDEGGMVAMPMPEWAVREMVADWIGASRAYTGSAEKARGWYETNGSSFNLHPATRALVEETLCVLIPEPETEGAPTRGAPETVLVDGKSA